MDDDTKKTAIISFKEILLTPKAVISLIIVSIVGAVLYASIFKPELIKQYGCTQEKKPEFVESKFEPALKTLIEDNSDQSAVSAAIFAENPAGARKLLMHFNPQNGALKQYQSTEYSLYRADSNILAVGQAKAGGVQCKEITPESSYGDYLKEQEGVKVICAHRIPNDKTQYVGFILVYFKEFPADWVKAESLPVGNERTILKTKFNEPFDRAAGEVVKF